jgi:pimeloyl-ACP methyl ester carboxylesterase
VNEPDRIVDRQRRPSYLLLALEGPRAASELAVLAAARPLLAQAPKGDGHPVLVLPGLRADDRSTLPLRRYLRRLDYHVHGWGLGANVGPTDSIVDGIRQRVRTLHDRYDEPMSLVGWSLGGIYAREIARAAPQWVRQVITLGSPFRDIPGEESHPAAFVRTFRRREPRRPPDRGSLPVPATAIFSRSDGVVPWRASQGEEGPRSESIEVVSSHCGLGHHPAALWAIADRLAQPPGAWHPFRPSGGWAPLFPKVTA